MTITTGRGAWSQRGMGYPGVYYQLPPANTAYVGSQVVQDAHLDQSCNDFRAVNWGVKAIQSRCNELVNSKLVVDGWFGTLTDSAVRYAQTKLHLAVDGAVGPATAKAFWRPLVVLSEAAHGLSGNYTGGIMFHESGYDPGAVGYTTPGDKGLDQWNSTPYDEAFDYHWSIPQTAARFAVAWQTYASKGAKLQIACSIAQHNSPTQAASIYSGGHVVPGTPIANYISAVISAAAAF